MSKKQAIYSILFLGGIVLLAILSSYSRSKGAEAMSQNHMSMNRVEQPEQTQNNNNQKMNTNNNTAPQQFTGVSSDNNEQYASVSSNGEQPQMPSSCSSKPITDPKDLLPSTNNDMSLPQPINNSDFLSAGHHIGIDTVGQSLRNANLQLRSEPPNPQVSVGPWQQSTIEPDLMRVPLELGCGSQ